MSTKVIEHLSTSAKRAKYNYKNIEFQVIRGLFSPRKWKICSSNPHLSRTPRFYKIFLAMLSASKENVRDIVLMILHIYTQYDPCAVCAGLLCNLSKTLMLYSRKFLLAKVKECDRVAIIFNMW